LPSLTPDHRIKGVNNHIPSIVLFIDQAIEEHEQELVRLRKARADLVHVPDRSVNNRVIQIPANGKNGALVAGKQTESIGDLLIEALTTNGSLTVKQIHQWIISRGKLAKYHTVSSFVNYYLRKEYIKRVAYGTYALGDKPPKKGAPKPTLTNGAPVPKELRSVLTAQK
jgi:hypothetical protein